MRITLQNDLSKVLFRDDNILKHVPGLKNLTIMMDFYPTSSPIDVADHNGTGGVFEAVLECGHQLQSLTYEVLGRGSSISGDIEGLDSTINNNNNNNNNGCRGIELLKRSPNLKHLKAVIHRQRYPEALQQMVKTYSSGQHPSCLEHLELLRLEGSRGQAALKELLQVSAQSTGLKTFSLDLSCVSATVLTTLLEHHATSLEKMVEIDSMGLSADNVCSLLTKCPRLKHVEASIWSDGPWLQDVLQSPWICADLRNLHLKVRPRSMWSSWERGGGRRSNDQDVKERIPEPRKQFWLQIGALKDLECVHLNLDPTHPLSTDLLTIEREDLEPLIGLRRLKEIRIPHGNKFMGVGVKEELQRRRPGLRIVYN
ncbi:hypothetical protein BGX31_007629 [Mortierella sp. GBA43]|nr:hypothetical protein BGX31_007629 [Mortierella sp. GBA43]